MPFDPRLFLIVLMLPALPSLAGPLAAAACLERLDAAVSEAREGNLVIAERQLAVLAERCEHLPQIQHDLGVIAERRGDRAAALEHLEAALLEDPRAADTVAGMRALHRQTATAAYARALGATAQTPLSEPQSAPLAESLDESLDWQDSGDVNADALRSSTDRPELRSIATLDYELYDWWLGAANDPPDGWLAHYSDDYPRRLALAQHGLTRPVGWDDVGREIAFTENDAVAILEHAGSLGPERRLLLLRLQGNRWKIYQETPL